MQLTIFISPDISNTLRQLAGQDCRSINQEAKWLLTLAVKQAACERRCLQEAVAQEMRDEPALQP